MKKRENLWNRIVGYFYRTWKIKLMAFALIVGGCVPLWIDNDATALVFILFFALPLLILDDKD